ncbi:sodium:proton antiporter [Bacillus lacus]|uniref:Sodium:proton antiporter n=1 Tax=Metabacillus lacus TaxID=1983721 RepID=A0A7X2J227_9BACI|nr:monovalent cation:proton antiporter family protein [Metabacillus lacus]MRX73707.1 sodium:proton antiporter [Metabacillus lacus]
MEHGASVASLVIVIVIALLTPILMHRFRLNFMPVVVAEILMGLIIGKSGLNLVEEDMWLETLSMLGFIFLMFLSGLEIDFTAFSKGRKKEMLPNGRPAPNTFAAATLVFLGIFILSLVLSLLLVAAGFIENAFLMTLVISTVSLGVVVPTLKEAGIMKRNIGQIILLVAVIADLVTMILLAVFASVYGNGESNIWLLLVLFGAGVAFYLIGKIYKNRKFLKTMSKGTVQIGTRAVFALIIVLVAISETIGAENILGAFLAGVLVSLLSPNKEMVQKLDSFGYGFLIPIFFVMVGVKLNIWELFDDPQILLLIPMLFLALLLSKVLPSLLLIRWFGRNTALASGILLTSTLSLVIAAAAIGENVGVIDSTMSGVLILVAVLTCIITPIGFKKLFPASLLAEEKQVITFVGANQMTLPVTRDLNEDMFQVKIFHTYQDKADVSLSHSLFAIQDLPDYELKTLEANGVFKTDILVAGTGNEDDNAAIALLAKELGVKRVISSIDSPELEQKMKEKHIDVFSVMLSAQTLLRALIETPGAVSILTNKDTALQQVSLYNSRYEGMMLRHFPFTGDVILVRIFRGDESLVPHGDTRLLSGDRLILTGTAEYVRELKKELERGRP